MATKEQEDQAYADAMSEAGASVLRAFGLCTECGEEECECGKLTDAKVEALLAQAIANENVELVDLCETALKPIVQPNLKRQALDRIAEILRKEAA
jgi:hypothetical protein